jgi:hypothetical protein
MPLRHEDDIALERVEISRDLAGGRVGPRHTEQVAQLAQKDPR